jgi:SAM-dependent methyltransferase
MSAMPARFLPPPRDPAVEGLLGEIPPSLLSDQLYEACELVERYASDWAVTIARRLELEPELRAGTTVRALLASRNYSPAGGTAVAWLFARLAAAGVLDRSAAEAPVYRLPHDLPTPELSDLRALVLANNPANAPTLAILDAAGEAFPKILAGTLTGEQALFTGARMALWTEYFHNANPLYALTNRIAAIAAANRLPPSSDGLRILEIGAGAGSAAEALLDVLQQRGRLGEIVEYRLTEPNPMLRRRAMRALGARFPSLAGLALAELAYDIDQAPAGQGLAEGRFDLVYAVNVLHIARDLGASLAWLRSMLRPGGFLVGGECLRLFAGQTIPIELVFEQLTSFTDVEVDPRVRTSHGFLMPEQWQDALLATGFVEVAVVPDLARIRHLYPRFFSGAICGCRPGLEACTSASA